MGKTTAERPTEDHIGQSQLVGMLELMLLTRRFEESLYELFRADLIGGYLHRYDGQEAAVVGIIPQLRLPGDYVLCTYRDHAHALACGMNPRAAMAELLGRATGCAGGKGGSMHMILPERGFLGGDGIVGGPVPISVGVGYSIKYRGGGNVCVCYFGDGAMNQGGVHEALNLAGLLKIPVLYVLENNQYAMGTSVARSTSQPDFVQKAKAHGIAGEQVDGMDLFAVHAAAERAIERIRKTGEAYFLEVQCYRFVGHGIGDDNTKGWTTYRTEQEIAEWRQRDPLIRLGDHLVAHHMLTREEVERKDEEARRTVEDAVEFAKSSPEPPLDALYDNVYS